MVWIMPKITGICRLFTVFKTDEQKERQTLGDRKQLRYSGVGLIRLGNGTGDDLGIHTKPLHRSPGRVGGHIMCDDRSH